MNKERDGLYYPGGKYRSHQEIKRKLASERLTSNSSERKDHPLPPVRDFSKWTDVMTRRQEERRELLEIPESVSVESVEEAAEYMTLLEETVFLNE